MRGKSPKRIEYLEVARARCPDDGTPLTGKKKSCPKCGKIFKSILEYRKAANESQQCRVCEKVLPIEEFGISKLTKAYQARLTQCNECKPILKRLYKIKVAYKLDYAAYMAIYKEQEGLCAICGQSGKPFSSFLHVDHCHKTGKVRGLLCNACNFIVGQSKERIGVLENAIKYLEKKCTS